MLISQWFTTGVVARFRSGVVVTQKSRPDISSVSHCLVTVFREGRAQWYRSLAPHPRSFGHGGIQGAKGTGVSFGR